jgi:hypothetical protein
MHRTITFEDFGLKWLKHKHMEKLAEHIRYAMRILKTCLPCQLLWGINCKSYPPMSRVARREATEARVVRPVRRLQNASWRDGGRTSWLESATRSRTVNGVTSRSEQRLAAARFTTNLHNLLQVFLNMNKIRTRVKMRLSEWKWWPQRIPDGRPHPPVA